MTATAPRVADGLRHRLICSLPILLAMGGMTLLKGSDGLLTQLCWLAATVLGSALAFLAPVVLTGGFDEPFPPSRHLALIGRRTQGVLGSAALLFCMAPQAVRLVGA